jgi:hypothetical protein
MTKPKTTDIDPHSALLKDFTDTYKHNGGRAWLKQWSKNNRTLFLQLYARLMAQPTVTNFNKVTIAVNDGNDARQRLERAFMNVIEARKLEHGTVIVDGFTIDNRPQPRDGISHTAPPATPDDVVLNDRQLYRREAAACQREAADARRAAVDPAPQPIADVVPTFAAEPSTTARYLEWASTRRDPWKNYG